MCGVGGSHNGQRPVAGRTHIRERTLTQCYNQSRQRAARSSPQYRTERKRSRGSPARKAIAHLEGTRGLGELARRQYRIEVVQCVLEY